MFWKKDPPPAGSDEELIEKFKAAVRELADIDKELCKRRIFSDVRMPHWDKYIYIRPRFMEYMGATRTETKTEVF